MQTTEIDPDLLGAHVARMREYAGASADASEFEHAICTALVPFAGPDTPDEPFLAMLEAIERTGDGLAATLLERSASSPRPRRPSPPARPQDGSGEPGTIGFFRRVSPPSR